MLQPLKTSVRPVGILGFPGRSSIDGSAYEAKGESALINSKPCPQNPTQRVSKPIEEYTAIDDATRIRVIKSYSQHTQKNAIDFIDHVLEKLPFRIKMVRTDNGHEFQPSFTGT
jgi:hypothetical protein